MIEKLRKLFTEPAGSAEQSADENRRLAAAALLVEVARADFQQDAEEEAAMRDLLCSSLSLDRATVDSLLSEASDTVDEATSLYDFTRLVNDHYSYDEKFALVGAMWQVAYADKSLNKYEEHLIRRVSELIYLKHEDFIRGKLAAKPA
ncbi:TerB family tellurite resistance protein [Congregibacter sp.]|nr:TerB family tellurite resistance protein [Congregibacter sp.]MDA8962172.1 TerB family tellurite resistance protein [Congregibacter sp.]